MGCYLKSPKSKSISVITGTGEVHQARLWGDQLNLETEETVSASSSIKMRGQILMEDFLVNFKQFKSIFR